MVHNVKGLTCSKDFCGRDECWIKTPPVVHPENLEPRHPPNVSSFGFGFAHWWTRLDT